MTFIRLTEDLCINTHYLTYLSRFGCYGKAPEIFMTDQYTDKEFLDIFDKLPKNFVYIPSKYGSPIIVNTDIIKSYRAVDQETTYIELQPPEKMFRETYAVHCPYQHVRRILERLTPSAHLPYTANHVQVFLPRAKTYKLYGSKNYKCSSLIMPPDDTNLLLSIYQLKYAGLNNQDHHVWEYHFPGKQCLTWNRGEIVKYRLSTLDNDVKVFFEFDSSREDLKNGIMEYKIDDFIIRFFDTKN